ncbi:unnamed protein product [Calypogeia fissa]
MPLITGGPPFMKTKLTGCCAIYQNIVEQTKKTMNMKLQSTKVLSQHFPLQTSKERSADPIVTSTVVINVM